MFRIRAQITLLCENTTTKTVFEMLSKHLSETSDLLIYHIALTYTKLLHV